MESLAAAIPPPQIGRVCYGLYERFRPDWRGWGQKGALDLRLIRELGQEWEQ